MSLVVKVTLVVRVRLGMVEGMMNGVLMVVNWFDIVLVIVTVVQSMMVLVLRVVITIVGLNIIFVPIRMIISMVK